MKQLLDNNGNPTGLWAVEVPEEADKIFSKIVWDIIGLWYSTEEKTDLAAKFDFDFEILGECTKEAISFDVEPYIQGIHEYEVNKMYYTKIEGFLSFLKSNGLFWDNPFGENIPELVPECCDFVEYDMYGFPECCCCPIPTAESHKKYDDWTQAENSRIKGKIIILKQL